MGGIFISYRRQDSAGWTGHLSERLEQCFGTDQIFMDIEKIEAGTDFVEAIEKAVSSCSILLAIIGPAWLTSADHEGRRRLDLPEDFICLEIATALKRDIRVIPVLVGGAVMPVSSELPDELKSLTRRQAHELTDNRWEYDTEQLVKFIEKAGLKRKEWIKPEPGPPVALAKKLSKKALASVIIAALILTSLLGSGVTQDMKIGYLVLGLVALALGWLAFSDTKLQKAKGKALAITGIVLSVLTLLVDIGLLSSNGLNTPKPAPLSQAQPAPSQPYNSQPLAPAQPVPAPVSPPSFADLTGVWIGADGLTYNIQQQGNMVTLAGGNPNQVIITARGVINGLNIELDYRLLDGTGGKVWLKAFPNGRRLKGRYQNMANGMTGEVLLTR